MRFVTAEARTSLRGRLSGGLAVQVVRRVLSGVILGSNAWPSVPGLVDERRARNTSSPWANFFWKRIGPICRQASEMSETSSATPIQPFRPPSPAP